MEFRGIRLDVEYDTNAHVETWSWATKVCCYWSGLRAQQEEVRPLLIQLSGFVQSIVRHWGCGRPFRRYGGKWLWNKVYQYGTQIYTVGGSPASWCLNEYNRSYPGGTMLRSRDLLPNGNASSRSLSLKYTGMENDSEGLLPARSYVYTLIPDQFHCSGKDSHQPPFIGFLLYSCWTGLIQCFYFPLECVPQ